MYTFDDVSEDWVDNNKEILYEYFLFCRPDIKHPRPLSECEVYMTADVFKKYVSIHQGIYQQFSIILIVTEDTFKEEGFEERTSLNSFNKYVLRRQNLNILLDA